MSSNVQLSDTLSALADGLKARHTLTASEALALHCMRLAARLLYKERQVVEDWHRLVHGFFRDVETREGDMVRNRHEETSVTAICGITGEEG